MHKCIKEKPFSEMNQNDSSPNTSTNDSFISSNILAIFKKYFIYDCMKKYFKLQVMHFILANH